MGQSQNQGNKVEATQAPSEYFTGTAWIKALVKADQLVNCNVSDVTFEPGARNNWHTHPGSQILIVTEGIGYYQKRGEPIRIIQTGDVIAIPAAYEHWHGAAPDSKMTHLAINPNSEKGPVNWLERVTDEEYYAYKKI